jgi:hypothetical protein
MDTEQKMNTEQELFNALVSLVKTPDIYKFLFLNHGEILKQAQTVMAHCELNDEEMTVKVLLKEASNTNDEEYKRNVCKELVEILDNLGGPYALRCVLNIFINTEEYGDTNDFISYINLGQKNNE